MWSPRTGLVRFPDDTAKWLRTVPKVPSTHFHECAFISPELPDDVIEAGSSTFSLGSYANTSLNLRTLPDGPAESAWLWLDSFRLVLGENCPIPAPNEFADIGVSGISFIQPVTAVASCRPDGKTRTVTLTGTDSTGKKNTSAAVYDKR